MLKHSARHGAKAAALGCSRQREASASFAAPFSPQIYEGIWSSSRSAKERWTKKRMLKHGAKAAALGCFALLFGKCVCNYR